MNSNEPQNPQLNKTAVSGWASHKSKYYDTKGKGK
jgi:hypothetical protein